MTAPDSRDSVERIVAEMREQAEAAAEDVTRIGKPALEVERVLNHYIDRLQALARGPQQAGGEDYSALKTRLRDSAMLSTLPEWCRKELEQGADAIAALQAKVARLREARNAGADLDNNDRRDDADFWWTVAAFRGVEMARQIDRAEAAEAALREAQANDRRYRWLRHKLTCGHLTVYEDVAIIGAKSGPALDAAIDAAREARLVRDGDSGEGES